MKVLHIGCDGNWGKNHRKILEKMDIEYTGVDIESYGAGIAEKTFRSDAVIITTSTVNHFPLILRCLELCIPVFCEKPVCVSRKQLHSLKYYSDIKPIFMSGHQLLFMPELEQIKKKNPFYMSSHRTGAIPRTEGAILSLAVHDIAVAMHVLGVDKFNKIDVVKTSDLHEAKIFLEWNLDYDQLQLEFRKPTKVGIIKPVMKPWGINLEGPVPNTPHEIYLKIIDRKIAEIYIASRSRMRLRHTTFISDSGIDYMTPDNWGRVDVLQKELEYFIDCVATNTPPKINNLRQTCNVMETCFDIMEKL